MKAAPLPQNESERLQALRNFEILDTESEEIFDELTELAAEICETPIVLISLIDKDRQWFKSSHGLDCRETPRDLAFCAHAILQDELFEIQDSFNDARFFDNPLAMDAPHVRFYAGMPLKTSEGLNIGTLCAIDSQPRILTDFQKRALNIIAKQVMCQMELRQLLKAKDLPTTSPDITTFHTQALHLKVLADLCLSEFNKGNLDKVQEILNKISHNSPDDSKRLSGL